MPVNKIDNIPHEDINKVIILMTDIKSIIGINSASLVNIIPSMTSNTTPSGTVFWWNQMNWDNLPWHAFDSSLSTFFMAANQASWGEYIGYQFTSQVTAYGFRFYYPTSDRTSPWTGVTVYGSNNGTEWTSIHTESSITWGSSDTTKEYSFNSSKTYQWWRFNPSDSISTGVPMRCYSLELLGYS